MEIKAGDNNHTHAPGNLDLTFGTEGRIEIDERGTANSTISDKDGKLVVVSHISDRFRLSRYLVDGTKDDSFEERTWNFEDGDQSTPQRVLLQEDGKILVIGESLKADAVRPAVTRFNPSGSPDLVFGRRVITTGPEGATPSRSPYKFADGCLQKGQKILIAATYTLPSGPLSRLFCLQADGETDKSFGGGSGFIDIRLHGLDSYANNVQIQGNGSIIVAGSWRYVDQRQRTRTVARYTDEGILDYTFGQAGYTDVVVAGERGTESQIQELVWADIVSRVAIQDDDKIIIAGYAKGSDGNNRGLLARLEKDGSIDENFNKGVPLLISGSMDAMDFCSIGIDPNGKIVAVGSGNLAGTLMEVYERISKNGVRENFWSGYSIGTCTDVTIQPGGRVIISGSSGNNHSTRFPRIWGRLGA